MASENTTDTLRKALEALEYHQAQTRPIHKTEEAIVMLRTVLSQQAQEPHPESKDALGWKEAAIAWNVCASIHRKYAKGKDALFCTRQADFVRHFDKASAIASCQQAPAITEQAPASVNLSSAHNYMIGQRVFINQSEIGTVVLPPDGKSPTFGIWVYSPNRGYACDFAIHNISPLPNGQV